MEISVIIPCFNVGPYLNTVISNLLQQKGVEVEFLFVNDGSTDTQTKSILSDFESKGKISVIETQHKGAGNARNEGIKRAKGDFVIFFDVDDQYPSNYTLSLLLQGIKKGNQLICGGSFSEFNIDNGQLTTCFSGALAGYSFANEGVMSFRDYQFNYGFHRFLFKRNFLVKNGILFHNLTRYQDPIFLVKSLHLAGSFYAITDVVYQYNFQPSRWKEIFSDPRKLEDSLEGMCSLLEFSLQNNYLELARRVLEQLRFHRAFYVEAFKELSTSKLELINSKSWRYTSPLRNLKRFIGQKMN